MRVWIASVLLTALAATPAFAQGTKPAQPAPPPQQKPAEQKPAEQKPAAPVTMEGSPLAGVRFAERPFPLRDDGTYAEYMSPVAAGVGRTCGRLETYGWEFTGLDEAAAQARADRIFQTTMGAFKAGGYTITEVSSKVAGPGLAVYTADTNKKQFLLFWAPVQDAIMLLLCETGAKK
ncbi:MAG TPA: hypothetical protein VD995_27520 [Azospirillum sp.]|nr:hypothetical protein [Azospirillum sp.]